MAITAIAVFAAVVQLIAAILEGKGVLFGLVMAMAPVAAITLWVVEMRRYFRLRGRAAGTVAPPASRSNRRCGSGSRGRRGRRRSSR